MDQEIVALIPVREGSQRVKNKNFRPFANEKSLMHLKIRQLKEANCFDSIYVSSDGTNACLMCRTWFHICCQRWCTYVSVLCFWGFYGLVVIVHVCVWCIGCDFISPAGGGVRTCV